MKKTSLKIPGASLVDSDLFSDAREEFADIEFVTRYLVMRQAPEHLQLLDCLDHWCQTEALAGARDFGAERRRTRMLWQNALSP